MNHLAATITYESLVYFIYCINPLIQAGLIEVMMVRCLTDEQSRGAFNITRAGTNYHPAEVSSA
jgi:hypothetical protein